MIAAIIRRDNRPALAALAFCVAASWAYLIAFPTLIPELGAVLLAYLPWTAADAAMMASRWAVMMVAIMLPGATAFILIYRRVALGVEPRFNLATGALAIGYLAVWIGFSLEAMYLQAMLERIGLLSAATALLAPVHGAWIIAAAGLYQLSPAKRACLSHCRAPAAFIGAHWRSGIAGAFRIGAHHGLWCLGSYWAVILLLFAAGILSLTWVALITAYVLIEKIAPRPDLLTRISGGALIALAVVVGLL